MPIVEEVNELVLPIPYPVQMIIAALVAALLWVSTVAVGRWVMTVTERDRGARARKDAEKNPSQQLAEQARYSARAEIRESAKSLMFFYDLQWKKWNVS